MFVDARRLDGILTLQSPFLVSMTKRFPIDLGLLSCQHDDKNNNHWQNHATWS